MDISERKFVFSRNQLEDKKKFAENMHKTYTPGYVIVNGKPRPFTEMLTASRNSNYPDSQIVTVGSIRTIHFEPEKTE